MGDCDFLKKSIRRVSTQTLQNQIDIIVHTLNAKLLRERQGFSA